MKLLINAFSALVLSSVLTSVSAASYWTDIDTNSDNLAHRSDRSLIAKAKEARYLQAGVTSLRDLLLTADNVDVELPLPNGDMVVYHLEYSPIAEQGLLDQFPEIRTFRGVDVSEPSNKGRFSISPMGFRGMFRHNGETVFIDPQYIGNDQRTIVYQAKNAQSLSSRPHDVVLQHSANSYPYDYLLSNKLVIRNAAKGSSDGRTRTYRIAVAATGEYTQRVGGGTKAGGIAAITSAINRVNEVFENDLGIRLILVANNADIVFTDSGTDPFVNDSGPDELDINQTTIDNVIGASNYDIGHLFSTGDGGIASLGSVCRSFDKAQGLTGLPSPTGDAFYINYVAHEVGHQFGANHSFNGTTSNCSGENRNQDTAYEPGSGSTIMAYAGICGSENLQSDSDPYFHAGSIEEINAFIQNPARGGSCFVEEITTNLAPNASAGADVTIPANTPFVLTGSATDLNDPDRANLSYVWEQMDTGTASSSQAEWVDDGSRVFFRSIMPSNNPVRYLPNLPDVLDGTLTPGESYPTTDRNINFRFTVRDGDGQTAYENKVLTVTTSAGPFLLNSPSSGDNWNGGTETVIWNVANTDSAPVSCANVDILFSGNGGSSFDTVLIANTPNDGSQIISVPAIVTNSARVMVRCSDNVFYAVGDSAFQVSAAGASSIASVSSSAVDEGEVLTFTVTLDAPASSDFDTTFSITNGTASDGDYGVATFSDGVVNNGDGTITIPANLSAFTITLPTVEDTSSEENETLTVNVGGESAAGTINNDDGGTVTPPSGGSGGGSSGGSSGFFIVALLGLLLVSRRKRA